MSLTARFGKSESQVERGLWKPGTRAQQSEHKAVPSIPYLPNRSFSSLIQCPETNSHTQINPLAQQELRNRNSCVSVTRRIDLQPAVAPNPEDKLNAETKMKEREQCFVGKIK